MRFIYLLLLAFVLVFSSCEKEETTLKLIGTWLLFDGYLYMDNMETYEKIKYEHFGDGKTTSQLTGFNKPDFEIESLEQNVTTWEFQRDGDVILNGDEDKPMFLEVTGNWTTIIEHPDPPKPVITMLGGSARPFQGYTYDYDSKVIIIKIQEQVGSYEGYNVEWHSELFFRRIDYPL